MTYFLARPFADDREVLSVKPAEFVHARPRLPQFGPSLSGRTTSMGGGGEIWENFSGGACQAGENR